MQQHLELAELHLASDDFAAPNIKVEPGLIEAERLSHLTRTLLRCSINSAVVASTSEFRVCK